MTKKALIIEAIRLEDNKPKFYSELAKTLPSSYFFNYNFYIDIEGWRLNKNDLVKVAERLGNNELLDTIKGEVGKPVQVERPFYLVPSSDNESLRAPLLRG